MQGSSELLEVIDEADEVIGKQPRRIVHTRGLLHRGVHVAIRNSIGEFLLQRRSESKDVFPGHLDIALSEHVLPEETYIDAAVRGLTEEFGISTAIKQVLKFRLDYSGNDRHISVLFEGVFNGKPPRIDSAEIRECSYYPFEKVREMASISGGELCPWAREIVNWYSRISTSLREFSPGSSFSQAPVPEASPGR